MINDTMGEFVAEKAISMILNAKFETSSKVKIAIMGVTFKENVPDIRNTKIIGLAKALEEKGAEVFLLDPVADVDDVREEYGLELVTWEKIPKCDAIIVAVPHKKFMDEFTMEIISEKLTENKIILDLKGCFSREEARNLGINIWRL